MSVYFALVLFWFAGIDSATPHPLHLSVTNIDKSETNILNVAIKVFSNDIETVILSRYQKTINSENISSDDQQLIEKYISEKFSLVTNIKKSECLKLIFQKYLKVEDSSWIYFYAQASESDSTLTVRNSLLTDLFPDQLNLLIFNCCEKSESAEFNNEKTVVTFGLK